MSGIISRVNNDIIETYQGQDAQGDVGDSGVLSALADNANKIGDLSPLGSNPRNIAISLFDMWINVKDFGAKGDGVTNDTVAIQAAINYAYTNKKKIFFPYGHYVVLGSLILNDRVTMFGFNSYRSFVNDPTKWETWLDCQATNVFIGSTPGTTTQYFSCQVDIRGLVFKGTGKGQQVFNFFALTKSTIEDNLFYNFDYIINGTLNAITELRYNYFMNIYTSVLSTRLGTVKSTMTDSKIHHNYIDGTSEGNSVLIDLESGNYSDIHHNFFDFAYIGVRCQVSSAVMNISNNLFDVCFKGIYIQNSNKSTINGNRFNKSNKTNVGLFTALSSGNQSTYSTGDWMGIHLDTTVSAMIIKDNQGDNDILLSMTAYGYGTINTGGNLNSYNNVVVKMARFVDSSKTWDGTYLNIQEMNFTKLTSLPTTTGSTINTFDGHQFYYNGKLVRNDNMTFKDMMGTVVT